MSRRFTHAGSLGLFALALAACSQIIGLEDPELRAARDSGGPSCAAGSDCTLDSGTPGAGGSAGAAGSASNSGGNVSAGAGGGGGGGAGSASGNAGISSNDSGLDVTAAPETSARVDAATDADVSPPDASTPDVSQQPAEASVEASSDVSVDVPAEVGPPTCGSRVVDDAGVFVSKAGTDTASCGGRAAATTCLTIQHALDRAYTSGFSKVFVGPGTYNEAISLYAGIVVEGGWGVIGDNWTPNCTGTGISAATVQPATESTTVNALTIGGLASIKYMTIKSKAQGGVAAGDSLYGIMAVGATTSLTLDNVDVQIVNAGDGSVGSIGTSGTAGSSAGCSSVTASDGATGSSGSVGTGAPAGSFSMIGYTPAKGSNGTSATNGNNGTAGGASQCVNGKQCNGFGPAACPGSGSVSVCSSPGLPGCKGTASGPGGGGNGGGSSIGIFAWGATVTIANSSITAGNGGAGGQGAQGGPIGLGGNGVVGFDTADVYATCTWDAVSLACTGTSGNHASGGAAGGKGGNGGKGGQGGGGAGGNSYAVYIGASGIVTTPSTTLTTGAAGLGGNVGLDAGAGAGAPGAAKTIGP